MARYYRAEDGALQLLGAFDVAHAHDCAASPYLPGICAPDPLPTAFGSNEFSDGACTMPTVVALNPACGAATPPAFVLKNASACSTTSKGQLYGLGAAYTERPFLKNGQSCMQSNSNKIGTARTLRRELGPQAMPADFPVARVVDEGGGRLQVRTVETDDGQHLAVTKLVDSVAGGTCTPFPVEGQLRCLPDAPAVGSLEVFVDAACEHRGYVDTGTSCNVPKFVTLWDGGGCTPHYLEVGAAVTPQTMFLKSGGTCTQLNPPYTTVFELTEHPLGDAPLVQGT
jgi:hypothetical protein